MTDRKCSPSFSAPVAVLLALLVMQVAGQVQPGTSAPGILDNSTLIQATTTSNQPSSVPPSLMSSSNVAAMTPSSPDSMSVFSSTPTAPSSPASLAAPSTSLAAISPSTSLAAMSPSTSLAAMSPSTSLAAMSSSAMTASMSFYITPVMSTYMPPPIPSRGLPSKSMADVVAIIASSLLMLAFIIFAVTFGCIYRRLNRTSIGGVDATKKLTAGTDGTFYQGLAPHSAQILLNSSSSHSFATSPSDVQLNTMGGHVFFHQGPDADTPQKNRGIHSASYTVQSKA